jgi:hypothetical protein
MQEVSRTTEVIRSKKKTIEVTCQRQRNDTSTRVPDSTHHLRRKYHQVRPQLSSLITQENNNQKKTTSIITQKEKATLHTRRATRNRN